MSDTYGHGPEINAAISAWAQDTLVEDLTSGVARLTDAGRTLVLGAVVAELAHGTARRAVLIKALATAELLGYVVPEQQPAAGVPA